MAKKAPPPAIDFRAYFPEKSPRGVKLYVPYTAEFEDLPPASKYDAACELKLLEEEGGEPRASVLSFLEGEIDYWLTAAALEDPVFDLGHNFWIEPGKGGGLVQLHPHQQQLAIVEAFVAAWVAGAPLKLLLLKARQMGISTICMALALRLITRFQNMHAGFVAHTQDDMKTIFTKYKVAFDNDTFALKPGVEQQNTTELVLDNGGWVKGRTAGGKAGQMFRGSVLQVVHTCLAAGTLVIDGATWSARPVESIRGGDTVVTHSGQKASVGVVSSRKRDCIELKFRSMTSMPVVATPEHRFWTKTGWRLAGDLSIGDHVGFPLPKLSSRAKCVPFKQPKLKMRGEAWQAPDTMPLTYEFGRVCGLYLAEGYISRSWHGDKLPMRVHFAVHRREVERTKRWLNDVEPRCCRTISVSDQRNSLTSTVTASGASFARFIEKFLGSKDGKRWPEGWERMPREFLRGMVHGYLAGDGHCPPKRNRVISAPSIRIATLLPLRSVLAALGYGWATLNVREGALRKERNERTQWTLALGGPGVDRLAPEVGWVPIPRKRFTGHHAGPQTSVDGSHAWVPLLSVEPAGERDVFDLEVLHDDHSYCLVQGASHNSESAQFKDGDSDTFNAITPSLPKEDNSFYAWFDESTAFGRRGGFYERFLAAKYKPESTDWKLMFLPWNQRWNTLPPYVTCTAEERREILATLNEREYGWMEKWGVQPEQIKWARRAWKELVANDEEERAQIWMQEYPINDVEAFVAKGGTIFNHLILDKQLAVIKQADAETPPWVGSIRHAADTPPDYFTGLESAKYRTPKPSLEKGSGGPLTRWVQPMVGHRYLIGVDVAEGKKKGDYSAAVVYDLTKRRFVARWMARMFPEDFIEPLRLLSRYYNDAQLNIEVATFGAQLCRELEKTDRQAFLCLARDASQTRVGDPYELRWGWKTTDTSKRQLVQYMRKIIATQIESLTDPMMVEQLMLYEESQSDSGRINIEGAPKGKYDDVAMAGMICLMGVEDSGYRPPTRIPDAPKPNPWDDGDIPAPVEPTMKERVLATNRRLQERINAEESGMGDRFLEYE